MVGVPPRRHHPRVGRRSDRRHGEPSEDPRPAGAP